MCKMTAAQERLHRNIQDAVRQNADPGFIRGLYHAQDTIEDAYAAAEVKVCVVVHELMTPLVGIDKVKLYAFADTSLAHTFCRDNSADKKTDVNGTFIGGYADKDRIYVIRDHDAEMEYLYVTELDVYKESDNVVLKNIWDNEEGK